MLLKLIVNSTQVSDLFQCQIKYAFVHAQRSSIDVHIFPIIKLRNYMVPGQKNLKHYIIINIKNDLHDYHVFSLTFTSFKKSWNFVIIVVTCEANCIGSLIGWQAQVNLEIVDRSRRSHEFHWYFFWKFWIQSLVKNLFACMHRPT